MKLSTSLWLLLLAATLAVASASSVTRSLLSDSIAIKGNNCNTNQKYPVMCLGQKCCKAGLVCHWNGQCISVHKGKELCGDKEVCNGGCCPDGQRCTTCGSCHKGEGPVDCEMTKNVQGHNSQHKGYNSQQQGYNGQQEGYNGQQEGYSGQKATGAGEKGYAGEWKQQNKGANSIAIKGNSCNTNPQYPVMCLGQKCCKAGLVCHWNGQCISVHKGKELCGDKAVCNGGCCPDGQRCTTCGSCHKGDGPADCETKKYYPGPSSKQTTAVKQGGPDNGVHKVDGMKLSNDKAPTTYSSGQRQGYSDEQTEADNGDQGYAAGESREEQAVTVEQSEEQLAGDAEDKADMVPEEQQEIDRWEEVIEDSMRSIEG